MWSTRGACRLSCPLRLLVPPPPPWQARLPVHNSNHAVQTTSWGRGAGDTWHSQLRAAPLRERGALYDGRCTPTLVALRMASTAAPTVAFPVITSPACTHPAITSQVDTSLLAGGGNSEGYSCLSWSSSAGSAVAYCLFGLKQMLYLLTGFYPQKFAKIHPRSSLCYTAQ